MSYHEEKRYTLFSGPDSDLTSSVYLVQGFTQATIQSDEATSNLTIQGSNDDGFSASIVTWSDLTQITVAGLYTLDTGYRWLRAQRASADSDGWAGLVLST